MSKVVLPLPPTTNSAYGLRGSHRYMYKEAKQWKKDAVWLFLAHKGEEPTKITITYYLKFNRDVDGSHKLILDAMQDRGGGAGVMKDDNSITDLILHKEKDKDHPRVEIEW